MWDMPAPLSHLGQAPSPARHATTNLARQPPQLTKATDALSQPLNTLTMDNTDYAGRVERLTRSKATLSRVDRETEARIAEMEESNDALRKSIKEKEAKVAQLAALTEKMHATVKQCQDAVVASSGTGEHAEEIERLVGRATSLLGKNNEAFRKLVADRKRSLQTTSLTTPLKRSAPVQPTAPKKRRRKKKAPVVIGYKDPLYDSDDYDSDDEANDVQELITVKREEDYIPQGVVSVE